MNERETVQLQEKGVLILPGDLLRRARLKAGDILDLSELNGGILLTPRRAVGKAEPAPAAGDPEFLGKLRSMQEMLEDL